MKYLFAAALLCLASCHSTSYLEKTADQSYVLSGSENNLVDSSMIRDVVPYKQHLDSTMNVRIGFSLVPMEKGQPESVLGNFVADICLNAVKQSAHADFCVLNNGGLRNGLPEGVITRKNVFELMPFENELVTLTLSGNVMNELFGYIADKGGVPVSGVKLSVADKIPASIFINDVPFDSTRNYKVVTSDYLSNGGDKMDMFKNAILVEKSGIKIRDAIIDYLIETDKKGIRVNPKTDGRISK